MFSCSNNSSISFDRNRWINDDPVNYPIRRLMVHDIIDSKMLDNKNSLEVDSILGEANYTDTTSTGQTLALYYTIQVSYGFDIDQKYTKYLIVWFDTVSSKVKKVESPESEDRRSFLEKKMTN